ncbi:MAG: hypothetical protein K6G74_02360 [Bacilli bacterium]|nr:hypothetical protein [Bacilli bacterium]
MKKPTLSLTALLCLGGIGTSQKVFTEPVIQEPLDLRHQEKEREGERGNQNGESQLIKHHDRLSNWETVF